MPVVKLKVLKHRDFDFINITSKSEFLQFFMKHVGGISKEQTYQLGGDTILNVKT
jgi:hypothetical protein